MNENQKKIVIGAICVIVAMLLYPPYSFHGPNAITRNLGYAFLFDPPLTGYANSIPGTVDIGMLLVQWLAVVIVAAALWWLAKDKGYEALLEPKKRAEHDADLPKFTPTLTKNGLPDLAPDTRLAIWNPNVAANWSLIFTPAFGSYLHMLNWRTLGQSEKAASAQHWFYVSLAMLAVYVLIGASMGNPKDPQIATQGLAFLYLLVWYFASGRLQGKYVKGEFGSDYRRKPWAAALLIGIVACIGYFVAAFVIGMATQNIMQRKLIAYEEATVEDGKPDLRTKSAKDFLNEGLPAENWDSIGRKPEDTKHSSSVKPFPDGQNTLTLTDGTKYLGEFKDGKFNGKGTQTLPDGEKYVGRFKDDNRHGRGTQTLPNGDKYLGEFKDNNRHGQGTYTWAIGQKYVGEFRNGLQHGRGTVFGADGSILQAGMWKKGVFAADR